MKSEDFTKQNNAVGLLPAEVRKSPVNDVVIALQEYGIRADSVPFSIRVSGNPLRTESAEFKRIQSLLQFVPEDERPIVTRVTRAYRHGANWIFAPNPKLQDAALMLSEGNLHRLPKESISGFSRKEGKPVTAENRNRKPNSPVYYSRGYEIEYLPVGVQYRYWTAWKHAKEQERRAKLEQCAIANREFWGRGK